MTSTPPYIPPPSTLYRPFVAWTWFLFAVVLLDAVPDLFVQYWFNQSLGYRTIFWTNLQMQLTVFMAYGILLTLAVYLPVRLHARSRTLRKAGLHGALWIGIFGGWILAQQYEQFLLALHGVPFGRVDPVFARDIGFYVYFLPLARIVLASLDIAILMSAASCIVARWDELTSTRELRRPDLGVWAKLGAFAVPYVSAMLYLWGAVATAQLYLRRYGLLVKDNEPAGVRTGAAYVDLTGILSSLNNMYVFVAVELGLCAVAGVVLSRLYKHYRGLTPSLSIRRPVWVGAGLVALELCFALGVLARDYIFVQPNEPHIQREYIRRHIDATTSAYRLAEVEVHEWTPPDHPLSPARLQASKTVQNAPILPPWVSYLEEPPDIQHYQRMSLSDSTMVFGPLLQIYEQEQRLRPYYKFLSVDATRYVIDGEKRMFASAVRELPSLAMIGRQEWLKYWGSAALLFTHGMGLVMSPVNQVDAAGGPTYASSDVPPRVAHEVLEHEPRIYFGEGAKDEYVLTNIRHLKEFDFATAQGREEFTFPDGLTEGIPVDSFFKRLMFAAHTRDVTAFLFSRYIDPARTRVHVRRTPLARIRHLAPFLFLDSNSYAFVADKRVLWMVNALTTSDQYPYSFREILGDKADERAVEEFPERVINYAEDSVKATVDAYTGRVHLYKRTDDPIVSTWARIYPDLFEPYSAMPGPVEAQLTYPLQWFHIQFDDIYKRYHQRDPIEFYNVEDLWDDADDTLGSLGRGLSGFGTGDQMTFSYEGYDLLLDPADMPRGVHIGAGGDLQYAMLMPFTPEGGRNLRGLIVALQDPGSYGRLISLQIPQGMFVPGPEQVDAYIDNDRPVHQQVTMWIRHATEVMRGRTLLLPVGGDLFYLETIWVNSLQNDLPQLKLMAVRYRDRITSASTLNAAIGKRELFEAPEPTGVLASREQESPATRQASGPLRQTPRARTRAARSPLPGGGTIPATAAPPVNRLAVSEGPDPPR